jgi:hypothetical protein
MTDDEIDKKVRGLKTDNDKMVYEYHLLEIVDGLYLSDATAEQKEDAYVKTMEVEWDNEI